MPAKRILLVLSAIFLILTAGFAVWSWLQVDARISGHGWLAILLGVSLSTILGVALMTLMFYSSRSGRDQDPQDF